MSEFREQCFEDLSNVFFNLDEFAELHTISDIIGRDAKACNIIVDNETLMERKVKEDNDYIYIGDILFFVSKNELPFDPIVGNELLFDGKRYFIANVNESMGIFEIILSSRNGWQYE